MSEIAFAPRETLGSSIYHRLRNDIIMGHLAPGQRLKLDQLREDYNAGANTLREALARLAANGFVIAESQRGFEVTPISAEGLRDIANLRLLLEEHALMRSFARGDEAWQSQVSEAYERLHTFEEQLEKGELHNLNAWRQSDWMFHQALIAACDSEVLRQSHAEAFDKYLRYQMIALAFRPQASGPEHYALKEAALSRDAPEAIRLLRHHISQGVAQALKLGRL